MSLLWCFYKLKLLLLYIWVHVYFLIGLSTDFDVPPFVVAINLQLFEDL